MEFNEKLQQLRTGKNLTQETTCGAIICIKNSHFKMGKRQGLP